MRVARKGRVRDYDFLCNGTTLWRYYRSTKRGFLIATHLHSVVSISRRERAYPRRDYRVLEVAWFHPVTKQELTALGVS